MGFSSLDDFVNEVTNNGKFIRTDFVKQTGSAYTAGRWYDLSTLNGTPVANTFSGTPLAAQIPDSNSGFGIWHGGNVSTDTKHLINVAALANTTTSVPSVLMLVDLCLYYPGINMSDANQQNLDNTNTLTRYTDGVGLRSFLTVTATTGATAHSIDNTGTNYIDQDGNTAQHPVTVGCTASAITPHISHSGTAANNYGPFLPLAAGDYGVRQYTSFKLTAASGAGTAALCLGRPLATIPLLTANVMTERDLMNQLPSLPKIEDGACIVPLLYTGANTAAASSFIGSIEAAWG